MVSRETGVWSIDKFLRWYKRSVLKAEYKTVGPLSVEASVITLLSVSFFYDGIVVVLSPNKEVAESLYSVSYGLCPNSSFLLLGPEPSRDRVPGFISEGQRYTEEALSVVTSGGQGKTVFTTKGVLETLCSPLVRARDKEIVVRVSKKVNMVSVTRFLDRWGYLQTERVVSPLYYAVRGGILDVYLVHSRNPVRLEFFGDEVESIRLFNPYSQRTIKKLNKIVFLPRFIESEKKEENLLSLVSSKDSIGVYNVEVLARGVFRVCFDSAVSGDLSLKSEGISKNIIKRALSEKRVFRFFSFSEGSPEIKPPSFLPPECATQNVGGLLEKGFFLEGGGLFLFGSKDFPGSPSLFRSRWSVAGDPKEQQNEIIDISDLEWGENIVHEEFGIGVYRGIEKTGGNDCIKIKYTDGGSVFVPAYSFNKLHRLVGVREGSVRISSLSTGSWNRKKDKIKKHARSIAKDLLKSHALRQGSRGFVYEKGGDYYRAVCDSFPFQETAGQMSALKDVSSDMEKDSPMDRMICGDVGYGKTEIALRATIRVVECGHVVFVMAPTTVLAGQHYISFVRRFSPFGIHVELLSRFRTKSEQKKIIETLSFGGVDVLVGTHRLISDDVYTKNLGLIVIDEEHRFGVKHKEKIKTMRPSVDILTLTATPIPRTLKQSLVGLKNISTINTPPKSRRPIKTFLNYFDWEKIFSIIKNETSRGGQVYFVNNNIESLPFLAQKITKTFPNLKVQVAHGKTRSKTLESVMFDFFKNETAVLCCTTIVGSGLDVPNANSIIINNAHRLGLSQLYQLRGRVGRGGRQAFCYLFIPGGLKLEGASFQRLKTIEQNTSLGSGYKVALKDMDIRGAGDLFGTKQSGAVASVGFHMYNKILKEALDEERGVKKSVSIPVVSSDFDSGLPEKYVPLVEDRLYFYQSLALAGSLEKIKDVEGGLLDRFGPLPFESTFLLEVSKIRVLLTNTSVKKLVLRKNNLIFTVRSFHPFKSASTFVGAILNLFNVTDENLSLKNNKDKSVSVSVEGVPVGYSSIKKVSDQLETLFLK